MANIDREPQERNLLETTRLKAVSRLHTYLQTSSEGILRPDQATVMQDFYDFLLAGNTAGTIVRKPGTGKTVIAAKIIDILKLKTVIFSPTGEILDKTKQTIERFAPEVNVTNFDRRSKDLSGQAVNTTLASAQKIADNIPFAKGVELILVDEVDDETLGRERYKLWRRFPNALFLGLTATPDFSQLTALRMQGEVTLRERWTGMFTNRIHEMSGEEAEKFWHQLMFIFLQPILL